MIGQRRYRNALLIRSRSVAPILAILTAEACCTQRARLAPKEQRAEAGSSSRSAAAFAVDAHASLIQSPRRLKLRFYAQAPDLLRVEGSFGIGGVAVIVTGRGERVRIVVPSRRIYTECTMEEDLGSELIGMPVTGCEIAALISLSAGLREFLPCGSSDFMPNDPAPPSELPLDGPPDSYRFRSGLAQVKFEWDGESALPKTVDIRTLAVPQSRVSFTAFHTVPFPQEWPEDFFWEPLPAGARRVDAGALRVEAYP